MTIDLNTTVQDENKEEAERQNREARDYLNALKKEILHKYQEFVGVNLAYVVGLAFLVKILPSTPNQAYFEFIRWIYIVLTVIQILWFSLRKK